MRSVERIYKIKYLEPLELPYLTKERKNPFVRTNLGTFTSKEGALKYLHYMNGDLEAHARIILMMSQPQKIAA